MSKSPLRSNGAGNVWRARSGEKDRQPPVGDLGCELDRARLEDGEVDRDVGAKRPRHQLERLAEPGRVGARVGHLVVLALVLERFPAQDRPHHLDVLAGLPERLSRAGRASPRRPAGLTGRGRAGSGRRTSDRAWRRSSPSRPGCGRGSGRSRSRPSVSSSSQPARRAPSRRPSPTPRPPRPSRSRGAPPPARARSGRSGSSRAAHIPCRTQVARTAMLNGWR